MLLNVKRFGESIVLILICLSFLLGINHGFPSTTTVNDEMYFVGGVFRALDTQTIFPQAGDVPYGTINYLASYVIISLVLLVLLPWFGFSLTILKLWVINHYFYFYLAPRLVSILAAVGLLYLVYQLLKENISSVTNRLAIIILLFTNILTVDILRTGKVWVLSTFLVFAAFYYLYRVLTGDKSKTILVILFSALAASNFPLAAVTLLTWPYLFFIYYRRDWSKAELYRYWLFGLLGLVLVLGINYQGIKVQVLSIVNNYTLSDVARVHNVGLVDSLSLNLIKIFLLFAPLLVVGIISGRQIKNRKLFNVSAVFLVSYVLVLSLVARWSTDIYSYLRYLFPVGFFLTVMVIAKGGVTTRVQKVLLALLVVINLLYFGFTITYLIRPTTFNRAVGWIDYNLNQTNIAIVNHVGLEVDLPINQRSAKITKDEFCASRCQSARAGLVSNSFVPLVLTEQSATTSLGGLVIYHIYDQGQLKQGLSLVYQTENHYHYNSPHSIESLGDYFDPTFFRLDNLGKNLYIYKQL